MKLLLIESNQYANKPNSLADMLLHQANNKSLSASPLETVEILSESITDIELIARTGSSQHCLCLFDYQTVLHQFDNIDAITNKNKRCFTAIYRAPRQIPMAELRQLGRLAGYFFQDTTNERIIQAVKGIASGQRALPPTISEQLLDYYQSAVVCYDLSYQTNLTRREVEVLELLKQGWSNTKLADTLFISEHTIKSHLYQIFKKLNVQSRSQAITWAHKYLV